MIRKNPELLPRAKELRKNMTAQERKLWYLFLRTYQYKFYKQRIIESFVVDFYCSKAKLAIELDGSQHYTEQGSAYDQQRSAVIEKYGILVLRFSNKEVDENFHNVCETINELVQNRLA